MDLSLPLEGIHTMNTNTPQNNPTKVRSPRLQSVIERESSIHQAITQDHRKSVIQDGVDKKESLRRRSNSFRSKPVKVTGITRSNSNG